MKATFISKENNIAKFSVEFTAEELTQAQNEVYKKNKHRFTVDGFRKGKAPRQSKFTTSSSKTSPRPTTCSLSAAL